MPSIGQVAKEKYLEYASCVQGCGERYEVRKGIIKLFEAIDSVLDSGGLVFARMPTGYGKTEATLFLASAVKLVGKGYGVSRVIHVLPMRSLVRDVLSRALCKLGKESECREGLSKASKACSNVFSPLTLDDVAYQASIYESEARKDQLFLSTLVYTTLDSYVLNFSKVTPLRSSYASYYAARAAIYRSITVFDEAHLFTEIDMAKAYTSLVTIARSLVNAKLPVVFVTATLSDPMISRTAMDVGVDRDRCVVVSVEDPKGGREVPMCRTEIVDASNEVVEPGIRTELVGGVSSEDDVYRVVVDVVRKVLAEHRVKEGKAPKILIVRNTVGRAIETWQRLKHELGLDAVLIHARLTHGDRDYAEDRLRNAQVIVATQVIEAGIDIDADVLVTDPAPLAQLIQRAGRVCRHVRDGERRCTVYILNPGVNDVLRELVKGVYDERLTRGTMESLRSIAKGSTTPILWRWASRADDTLRGYSYLKLLNSIYSDEYLKELKLDVDVSQILEHIDTITTLHRKDAEKLNEDLCSFVRDSVEVPLLVLKDVENRNRESIEEQLNGSLMQCIDNCMKEGGASVYCIARCEGEIIVSNTINVSHEYLYRNLNKLRNVLRYVAVLVISRRNNALEPKIHLLELPELIPKLFSEERGEERKIKDSENLCREFYRLEKRALGEVIRKIKELEDDTLSSVSFLGIVVPQSLYIRGCGLEVDGCRI